MKAMRSTVTPSDASPRLLQTPLESIGTRKSPGYNLPRINLLKIKGYLGTSQEVMEKKGPHKKMLKMKEPPNNLLKTQGQNGASQ
jgi:hypothetical protein